MKTTKLHINSKQFGSNLELSSPAKPLSLQGLQPIFNC
jgi:hypothetical protein